MANLYNTLKSHADKMGIKPATLCRLAGVSPNLPTELKKGRKNTVKAETAQMLADYIGISVAELLYGESKKPDENADELERYLYMLKERPGLRALLKVHEGSTDEEIEANVRFIEQMRKK